MRLFELFQKYYKYHKLDDTNYMFDTDRGLRYLVNFEEHSLNYRWQLHKMPVVGFGLVSNQGDVTDSISKTGDSFTVFSTVGKIIHDHLLTHPAKQLAIGGSLNEPSRLKLYQTFIKLLSKFLPGWELELTSDNIDPNLRIWVIRKT